MRVLLATLAAALACAIVVPSLAAAKGDVRATLENPASLTRAQAGEHLRIAFAMNVAPRLPILDPENRVPPHPFGASGVYVRIAPAPGGAPVIVSADPPGHRGYPAGRYVADVTVPPGGIRALAIGLEGYQYVEGGPPRRDDVFFAIVNDPFTAPRASAHAREQTSTPWALLAGALGAVALLLLAYRGRSARRVAA
jgi:hypothetical protein